MTSIDEILAAMDEADEDGRVILVIDEDLRIITVPNIALVIGAERDKDVTRLLPSPSCLRRMPQRR